LCTNVTTHVAIILHSRLAASANNLNRQFSELQYLRGNFSLRLNINNFVSLIPKKQRHSLMTSGDTVYPEVSFDRLRFDELPSWMIICR